MLDVDTFLTTLYATTDDFRKSRPTKQRHPGPDASLSPSEVATLAVFARFSRFASEPGLLPLCTHSSARRFPHLARSPRAFPRGTHRGEWPCTSWRR